MKRHALAVTGMLFAIFITGCDLSLGSPDNDHNSSADKPDAPNGLKATAGYSKVSLAWQSANKAISYSVGRSAQSGGPYTEQAQVKATAYVDGAVENGTPYFYIVQGVNTAGLSAYSAEISATPQAGGADDPTAATLSTTLILVPPALTNQRDATFTFNGSGDVAVDHFDCQLDAGAWLRCTSPQQYSNLSEGPHHFGARAVSEDGTADATPVQITWFIDLTPPATVVTAAPAPTTSSASAILSFAGSDTVGMDRLDCRLDAGAWANCTSPLQISDLPAGTHTFDVRSADAAGNIDLTPATVSWIIDQSPPQTLITAGPGALTNATAAILHFSGSDNLIVSRFECTLDGSSWQTCVSPLSYGSLTTGAHVFNVRSIDGAGNADLTPATVSWLIDQTPPQALITSAPAAVTRSTGASLAFAGTDNVGVSFMACRFDAGAWAACTSPQIFGGLPTGTHTFDVRSVDTAGNTGAPATSVWTIDLTPPDTTLSAAPDAVTSAIDASIVFSGTDNVAVGGYECRLDAGAWLACTSPHAYAGLATGAHAVAVRTLDSVGNIDPAPSEYQWIIDLTRPDTSIASGPAPVTNATAADFAFTGTDNIAVGRFECRQDAGNWEPCTSPQHRTGFPAGPHTFEIRTVDSVGNTDLTPASFAWTVDLTAPGTLMTGGPAAITRVTVAVFSFGGSDNLSVSHFECRVDADAWQTCDSPFDYNTPVSGPHNFDVRAFDEAGNVDPVPAGWSWTLDLTPPDTTVSSGPAAVTTATGAMFAFAGTDNIAVGSYACRLDAGAWAVCTSPQSLTGVTAGAHIFYARASDTAGNADLTPASHAWTIDHAPPETAIESGPAAFTAAASATMVFSATDNVAVAGFECSWDTGVWASCVSPGTVSGFPPGDHIFEVRAFDAMGNTDLSPASVLWNVDVTLPDTLISGGPAPLTLATLAIFSFDGSDNAVVDRLECRLDTGAWQTCVSPALYSVSVDGAHNFDVRAIDGAGNVDTTPAGWSWTLDTTLPDTTITAGPAVVTSATVASFTFTGSDTLAVDHLECRLDAGAWTICTSPQDLVGVPVGAHTYYVRTLDTAGNADASPAAYAWTVDVTPPNVTLTGNPGAFTSTTSALFSFTGSDNVSINRFECRVDAGAWGTCTSPHFYPSNSTGSHTFNVQAIDNAGNADLTPATWGWTIDQVPPDTQISSGPAAVTGASGASFVFGGSDTYGIARFECRLDWSAWATCVSPQDYTGVFGGGHTFDARSVDNAGNADLTPSSWTWTIDVIPPTTTVSSGPASATSATSATFTFTGADNAGVDHFECRLDGGAWAPCASGIGYANLTSNITHLFNVRAVDSVGLVDASPATWSWLIGTHSGVAIEPGVNHTCELNSQGGVRCWGQNVGQLGDGTLVAKAYPVNVLGLTSGVVSISSSWTHTCAVTTGGGAKCWGYGDYGSLGDGSASIAQPNAVDVAGLTSGVASISAGQNHACAVTTGGGVKCWGDNFQGQVGVCCASYFLTPVDVPGLASGVASVSAGNGLSCAVTTGGAVKCWGSSYSGPTSVAGLTSGISAVSVGWNHACALTTGGGILCFGNNSTGQLGDGTNLYTSSLVNVSGLTSGVAAISAGYGFTCALLTSGGVKCWGSNTSGKLGDGTTVDRYAPVYVSGLTSGVAGIGAGNDHACAVITGTGGKCWGRNYSGQLGTGTASALSGPVSISGVSSVLEISAGDTRACAVTTGTGVQCWGQNYNGGIGDGTLVNKASPTDVSGATSGFASVSVGNGHSCGLTGGGGVKCWGLNTAGQLGDGTTLSKKTPVDVFGLTSGVAAISLGSIHSCVLTTGGGVKCWGDNGSEKIGASGGGYRVYPLDIPGLTSGVTAIAAGTYHTCALTTAGGVICWGSGSLLGPDANGTYGPVSVTGLTSGVAAISAGELHSCALTTAGAVLCWGGNNAGQLGDGTTGGSGPVGVSGLTSGIASIDVGASHTCAVTTTGTVKCWGKNGLGQLADGTFQDRLTPVDAVGLSSVNAVTAGKDYTCARISDGSALCWGYNDIGQLGDGKAWAVIPGWVIGF